MKAVNIPRVGFAEVVEIPALTPGPAEALVRVQATGICGSDVAGYNGTHAYRNPPVITGHEAVGTVVSAGRATTTVRAGDRVVIEPHIGCGTCRYCRSGRYNICPGKRVMGTPGWPGSFAELVTAHEVCLHGVPSGISTEQAVLVEPLCVAVHALRRAHVSPRGRFLVLGSGTIGLMHTLALSKKDPELLVATDIKPYNLEAAHRCGAHVVVDPTTEDVVERVLRLTDGEGVDACFVAFHAPALLATAIGAIRPGGTVVMVANSAGPVPLNTRQMQLNELSVIGTAMYTAADFREGLTLAGALGDSLTDLITHRITLAELPDYLRRLDEGSLERVIKVIVRPGDGR
jgi:L-iditol 2-dehydrogenase